MSRLKRPINKKLKPLLLGAFFIPNNNYIYKNKLFIIIMKKFTCLIIAVACFACTARAQSLKATPTPLLSATHTAANPADTLDGAETIYQLYTFTQAVPVVAPLTFQITFVKISGTAAATVKLQGTIDNVGWDDIGSAYTVTDIATQSKSWPNLPRNYTKYRFSVVGTGTQSVKFNSYLQAIK